MLAVVVALLRRDGELDLTDAEAALLVRMSAPTIDRRLGPERLTMMSRERSHTKPGTLLKSQILIRTWAEWDDAVLGFVEIDLVGHEGGNASGEHCFTLTVTDIATGWTVNRSVRNKAEKWVFEALQHVMGVFPFPIIGIDSDNGSEFINHHLFDYCVVSLRHGHRTGQTQRNLGARPGVHELSPAAAEARLQATQRRESDQKIRHRDHPAPARGRPGRHGQTADYPDECGVHTDQTGGPVLQHPRADRRA